MTSIAIVYHSATGRTRRLAEAVRDGAASVAGTEARVFAVEDAHSAQLFLADADAIIFGCPTYMGSASGAFKTFMDSTSAIWALQGWRDKLAAGFTHSAAPSGDKLGTLTQLAVFAAQHGMIWVGLGLPPTYASLADDDDGMNRLGSHLGAMAQSRPGGGTLPASDLKTAAHLGRRVAEAASRWTASRPASDGQADPRPRHPAARGWVFPPEHRAPLPAGIDRVNLREIVARPSRFEHHLIVCATVDGAQLEITTASEPLYFAHINVSHEYAVALPSGDDLVDRFPLRTFLSDAESGVDVGRYNHRVGDLVLHPDGLLHWPGRLRPPFEPFDFPPGMRRSGIGLVFCASAPTVATWSPLPVPAEDEADTKAYVSPPPLMVLASLRSAPGPLAKIGSATLSMVEVPGALTLPRGGWVVVLEALPDSPHFACDLLRLSEGATLDGAGIVRALVLESDARAPDPVPASWTAATIPPFSPFENEPPSTLPWLERGIRVEEISPSLVALTANRGDIAATSPEVPRYWLARTLFRVALHGLRLGYVETYGGVFVDDGLGRPNASTEPIRFGVRTEQGRVAVAIPRAEALGFIERLYRAVAPPGYKERLI